MKHNILFFINFLIPMLIHATNYGDYRQLAHIDFENQTVEDRLDNVTASLKNGAEIVFDDARQGYVAKYQSASKGHVSIDEIELADVFSISFWGKMENAKTSDFWRMFIALYAEDGSNIYLTPLTSWNQNSYVIMENKPYKSYKSLAGKSIKNDTWYHFVLTFNGSYLRIYIDGELQTEFTSLFRLTDHKMTKFYFGCNPDLNYPMDGRVDDIRIFHSALYPNQVQALAKGEEVPAPMEETEETNPAVSFTINYSNQYQTIQNFGASDGWNAQTVGLYFPENKKEKISELLFSTDIQEDGTPKGIGLSAWRFNIGAGTSEQGNSSRITHFSRRTECFLNSDKETYDWTKQAGQQWFLRKAALDYGLEDIIGWQNSPPVYFTKRGLGFRESGDAKSTILKEEHYEDFGNFLSEVIKHFKEEGIKFKYISPLNEPQHEWNASSVGANVAQEGTPWSNKEVADVVKAIDKSFSTHKIESKQIITEAGSINSLLNESSGFAAQQLHNFWNKNHQLYLAALPSFSSYATAHSYWSDTSAENIINTRRKLKTQLQSLNPEYGYWQTEYSLLDWGYKFGHKDGRERTLSSMECGISLARIIHADLTEADASGWQWWTTFELDNMAGAEERFALIRFEVNDAKDDGVYRTTKLLYSLGNYARFIRPGMKRIGVTSNNGNDAITSVSKQMVSSFTDGEYLVIVAINAEPVATPISFDFNGFGNEASIDELTPYVTTDGEFNNLKAFPAVNSTAGFTLPATSIVTFKGKINGNPSKLALGNSPAFKIYPNPASDYIQIESKDEIENMFIRDLSGRTVKQVLMGKNKSTRSISISELPKGLYLISLNSNGTTHTRKLEIK